MKDKIKAFLGIEKLWLFVAIALLFKLFFFYAGVLNNSAGGEIKLYVLRGDAVQYVSYCENFYQTGEHFAGLASNKDYSSRMPGLVFLYYPLRCILSQQATLVAIIILQIILSAFATYYLALLAYRLFKHELHFYFTFFAFTISSFVAAYNGTLYTESIATSLLIFSSYLLFEAVESQKLSKCFLSGLLMAAVIFLRPYMGLVWAVAAGFVFLKQQGFSQKIKVAIIYVAAFVLADAAWVVRNYEKQGKFIPLQSDVIWYKSEFKSLEQQVRFIRAFGFYFNYWTVTSQHTWFLSEESAAKFNTKRPGKEVFPARTFNGGLTYDSLVAARENLLCAFDSSKPREARFACDSEACRIFARFTANLKSNRPADYYILNRVRLAIIFLNQPLGGSLKTLRYPLNVLMVFIDSYANYMIIIGGLLGLLWLLLFYYNNLNYLQFAAVIPAYIILLFGVVIPSDEARYLVLGFPFLALCCSWFVVEVIKRRGIIWIAPFVLLIGVLAIASVKHNIKW